MQYTTIQRFIVRLLKTYRCLRDDQIDSLVSLEYSYDPLFAKRQRERLLDLCGHIVCRPQEGYSGMIQAEPDMDMIAAVDVMLRFRAQGFAAYRPGTPPFQLSFVKEDPSGKLRAYHVAVVHKGAEFAISQHSQCVCKGRMNAVLFLLDDIGQADNMDVPFDHFYVVQEKGVFQFYEGVTVQAGYQPSCTASQ